MKLTFSLGAAALSIACLALGSIGVTGGTLSSRTGTAIFRCNRLTPECSAAPPLTSPFSVDLIRGDGTDYQGFGPAEGGQGAHLYTATSGGETWIGGSGHTLVLDLPVPDDFSVYCTPSTCRKYWSDAIQLGLAEIQSNVVGPSDASPLAAHGLFDVPLGATWRTRLKISFNDPKGRNLLWGLNFNTIDYQNATNINVIRTAGCTWTFEPGANDRGGLSAFGNVGKGKNTRTDEGLYDLPFQLTLDVPSCQ